MAGELHDPSFADRPIGTNNLRVIVVDDAALALGKFRKEDVRGTWRLTVLPDGSYFVEDLAATPFEGRDISAKKEYLARMARALESDDPQRQYMALRLFRDTMCFSLVPAVLPLLDSDATVTVPDPGHLDTRTGPVPLPPVDSTLGVEARAALERMIAPLRDSRSPGRRDGEAVWRKWWEDILATEPFPRVDVAPGEVRTLAALPMNQSWPEPRLDPRGRYAVIGVSRLQHAQHGARSGIRLLGVEAPPPGGPPEDDFVYKAPLEERNCEPGGLAVAFGEDRIALAWKEYGYDDKLNRVKFMSLDPRERRGAPADLGIKRASHIAMCPFGEGEWLLACTAKPEDLDPKKRSDRNRKESYLLVLSDSGEVLTRTPPLALSPEARFGYHDGVIVLTVTDTPEGPALVYTSEYEGAFLVLLDRDLEIRRIVKVNDPRERASGFMPRVASNGRTLCVGWIQSGNYGYRLFARAFDLEGEALSDARLLSEEIGTMAGPVAADDGFVVAWTDFTETADQVRLAGIGADGTVGGRRVAFDGRAMVNPICLGAAGRKARILMYYWWRYPREVLLKDVALPE